MSNIFDMELLMYGISYQEKTLLGTLITEFAIFIPYFILTAKGHTSLGRVTAAVILLTVIQILVQAFLAITSRNRMTDERDRLIEARGFRAGYFALVSGIIAVFILLWTAPVFNSILLINVLLAALVIAEITKVLTQLALYRRAL